MSTIPNGGGNAQGGGFGGFASGLVDDAKAFAGNAVETAQNVVQERAAPVVERVQEYVAPAVEQIQERAAPAVEQIQERAAPAVEQIQERAAPIIEDAKTFVQNPVATTQDYIHEYAAPVAAYAQEKIAEPVVDYVQSRAAPVAAYVQEHVAPVVDDAQDRVASFANNTQNLIQERVAPLMDDAQDRVASFMDDAQERVASLAGDAQGRAAPVIASTNERLAEAGSALAWPHMPGAAFANVAGVAAAWTPAQKLDSNATVELRDPVRVGENAGQYAAKPGEREIPVLGIAQGFVESLNIADENNVIDVSWPSDLSGVGRTLMVAMLGDQVQKGQTLAIVASQPAFDKIDKEALTIENNRAAFITLYEETKTTADLELQTLQGQLGTQETALAAVYENLALQTDRVDALESLLAPGAVARLGPDMAEASKNASEAAIDVTQLEASVAALQGQIKQKQRIVDALAGDPKQLLGTLAQLGVPKSTYRLPQDAIQAAGDSAKIEADFEAALDIQPNEDDPVVLPTPALQEAGNKVKAAYFDWSKAIGLADASRLISPVSGTVVKQPQSDGGYNSIVAGAQPPNYAISTDQSAVVAKGLTTQQTHNLEPGDQLRFRHPEDEEHSWATIVSKIPDEEGGIQITLIEPVDAEGIAFKPPAAKDGRPLTGGVEVYLGDNPIALKSQDLPKGIERLSDDTPNAPQKPDELGFNTASYVVTLPVQDKRTDAQIAEVDVKLIMKTDNRGVELVEYELQDVEVEDDLRYRPSDLEVAVKSTPKDNGGTSGGMAVENSSADINFEVSLVGNNSSKSRGGSIEFDGNGKVDIGVVDAGGKAGWGRSGDETALPIVSIDGSTLQAFPDGHDGVTFSNVPPIEVAVPRTRLEKVRDFSGWLAGIPQRLWQGVLDRLPDWVPGATG